MMKLSEQDHYHDEEDGCMIVGGIQYDALALFDEVTKLEIYADKLADGLPDGMLPKDIELLRKRNAQLEAENKALRKCNAEDHELMHAMAAENEALREAFVSYIQMTHMNNYSHFMDDEDANEKIDALLAEESE